MTKLLKSTSSGRAPYIALEPSGPNFDFSVRRSEAGQPELWKHATKTVKRKAKGEGGAQAKKRSKNWDIDESMFSPIYVHCRDRKADFPSFVQWETRLVDFMLVFKIYPRYRRER